MRTDFSANWIVPFSDKESELENAGGKGAALVQLTRSGFPVPDGFILLPGGFAGDDLKAEVWTQAKAQLERMRKGSKNTSFAVRSSALSEDSDQASFAGEFETVLDVATDEAILEAIHTVRQSRHSDRVRAYSEAKGVDAIHEMAVLVQRLVRADISGVLFTADPVTGSRDVMTGNFIYGLGEGLVSGEVEPFTFTLKRPKGEYDGPVELKRFARKLFTLGKRLEQKLGTPQDIEWAIAEHQIRLLQSRPITTLQGENPITGEFNDSLTGDYVWSCVNVGEAMLVVMTPFTWSMFRTAFEELNILPGHSAVGNIGGRLYQNVTVGISVLAALGQNIEQISKEMGGVRQEYLDTMDQYLVPLAEATPLAVMPKALQVRRKQKAGLKNLEAYLAENPDWCRCMVRQLQAVQTETEMVDLLVEEILPRSREAFWRNYATALRYSELAGKLRRELTALVGPADADVLLSNVSRPDALLASLGPLVGLARVARGEMTRADYMLQWGHRGELEGEASAPRPLEDPDWLDQQLTAYAQAPVDVEAQLAGQRTEFEAAWERFRERHSRKVNKIGRRLERAAEAARRREAARSESTRLIWVTRTWVLQVGGLTGIGEGAFFLSIMELLDLLEGEDRATDYIPARQQTYERYKALPPYPLVIRGRFDPFQWAADPQRSTETFDSHGLLPTLAVRPPREEMILGMPGSAGQAEGLVRRLDSAEEGGQLQAGEILVTSQTNIGWTLLFPKAGAVVTDVGAPLSHAAIVARELGIPAVVNCADATMRLRTGDRVRVDGSQGIVEILQRGA
jgi:phosphohistidine swiveling domain-containing protein